MLTRIAFLLTLLCPMMAGAVCGPTPILDANGSSTNTKTATDGSSNCFGFIGVVDSTGANAFPAAAALGDTMSNPTTVLLGSMLMGWDATNTRWQRIQVDAATGTVKVDTNGNNVTLAAGSALAGKFGIDQTTPGTTNGVQPLPGTTGGWTPFLANALTTTIKTPKASAGKLGWASCANYNSVTMYVQFLDAASPTLGVTTPVLSLPITPGPANPSNMPEMGINFATAIKFAATTTATGSTAPTTALDCNIGYN